MAYKSVIKQNKVVDDNNVNQAFLADNTEDYYDGQALTIASGEVAPVAYADDEVFGICCTDRVSDTAESEFKINLRQPRTWDTFLLKTDFDLADANIGTYYGIIPEEDDDSNPTGWYVISTTGTRLQWRLISILWKKYGEFEFKRETSTDEVLWDVAEEVSGLISTWTAAPTTAPEEVGKFYLDTTNKKLYVSVAKTASTDRVALN